MTSEKLVTGVKWFAAYLFVLFLSQLANSHVPDGSGDRRQFYSYFTSTPPVINGCLTDKTTPEGTQGSHNAADANEWKDAYVRHMKMGTTGGDSIAVSWFFMNDNDYLYVGFTANSNNLGNNQSINLVFDQGIGGGSHNDILEGGAAGVNNGEFRVNCEPTNLDINEYSFNGTTWVQQNNGSEVFLALGDNFGISFMQSEWKIPLKPGNVVDDNHSYLNVNPTDELGMNIFYSTSSKGTFYWEGTDTSMTNPSTGNGWIDLKLGVQRDFVTFYGTYNAHGNPVIDGNITGGTAPDDGWRGSYFRNIVLTNFAGKTLNAMIYGVDDAAANFLYTGLKVFDNDNDANDSCIVYQEQSNVNTTGRNFILDNGEENALIANTTAYVATRDRYWSGGAAGSWAADVSGANQDAAGAWRGTYYEYEYKINRNAATDDIQMDDGGKMGFHIRYHDAEDGSDYFWEMSPNADRIQIDWNNNVYVATGWADMQLGAPYFQVVYPEDNSYLEGVTNVRIYAAKSAGDIDSASFYRKSNPGTRYRLTKIGSSNEWAGTWDVTALANGSDTLVFQVYDDAIIMDRIVNVIIKNDASAADPSPSIAITSPAVGSVLSGIVNVAFSASAAGGHTLDSTQISIDGASFIPTSAAGSHSWNTTLLADGSHTVKLRAVDDIGSDSVTQTLIYIVNNTPSVAITSPRADSVISGTAVVLFTASVVAPATIASTAISVDGGAFRATSAATSDTIDTQSLTDGDHTVQIKATDNNGKSALSGILKFVVRNAPTVVINSPGADSVISGTAVVLFTATAISPATIASTLISIDGGAYRATSTISSDTIDTQPLTDGDHIVQIKVIDNNGKSALSGTLKFVVRNAPTVAITSPRADSVMSGTSVVLFTATAVAPATVSSTQISIDGGSFRVTSAATSDTIDTQSLTDGVHTVQIKATDNNGKSALSGTLKFVVRNAPTVAITSPRADSVISGTAVVLFTATAVSPALIASTEISVDGGAFRATSAATSDTIDTQSLTDGDHTVQIKVIDNNGKSSLSGTLKFVVRNMPTVAITSPRADSVMFGTSVVLFTATAVSPALIASTEISVDGGAFRATSAATSDTIDTQSLTDGDHTVQIKVIDNNGKSSLSGTLKFVVRNMPTVAITSPRADSVMFGTSVVLFTATAVSPATIVSTVISVDGGAFRATSTATSDTIDTQPLTDGDHTVQIKVVDNNGKSALSGILKFVVRNMPSVAITSPVADARLSGTVVALFTATAISPAVIESTWISIDGGLYRATSTNLSDTIDTRLFAEGTHYFKIKVADNNNKQAVSDVRKFNVNNLPQVSLSYPLAGSVLSGIDTVRFMAVPVSPALIESTWISIDGGSWNATTSPTVCVLNTVDLVDGTHSVQIKARDNNGKTEYSSRVNVITRNAPTVAITYPAAGQYVSGTVTVRFTNQFVAPAVLDTVEISINGGSYVAASTESTYVWDTRTLNDVEHSIKLRVRDDRGKLGESEILIVKADNRAPVVTETKLNYGSYSAVAASGKLSFSALVFDRESDLIGDGVILRIPSLSTDSIVLKDDGLSGDTISGDHIYSSGVALAGLTTGAIAYSITASDLLGNRVTVNDTFYYDAIPPQLSLSVLPVAVSGADNLNGFVYVDNVDLTVRYSDANSGIMSGSLRMTDSTGVVILPESPVILSVRDTLLVRNLKLQEGVNLITVNVTDRAGNSTTATARLFYSPPKVTQSVGVDGGVVVNPNGTSITIPEGALFQPASITIVRLERTALPEPENSGINLIGPAYEFGPDGLIFKKEVTLSFSYTAADLDINRDGTADYVAESLAVYFLDGSKWVIAGDAVTDIYAKRVSVKTNHFTIYALGTRAASSGKIKCYWTKNPILRSTQSSFVYELPDDGKVSLSIFDAAGDLIRILIPENTAKIKGSYSIKWDGANGNNRYSGTGLYFYLFKAVSGSETKSVKKTVAIVNR